MKRHSGRADELLQSAYAKTAPERPYMNVLTIAAKVGFFSFPCCAQAYASRSTPGGRETCWTRAAKSKLKCCRLSEVCTFC